MLSTTKPIRVRLDHEDGPVTWLEPGRYRTDGGTADGRLVVLVPDAGRWQRAIVPADLDDEQEPR